MRLLLSSEALPAGTAAELAHACRRRAFAGLEVAPSEVPPGGFGVPVVWLRLGAGEAPEAAAEVARALGAGLLLPSPLEAPPEGIPLALLHETDPAGAALAAAWAEAHGAATAWQLAPEDAPERVAEVFERTRPRLAHLRQLGGGPEAEEGGPAADVLVRLALSAYAGTIAPAPSAGADLGRWARWLLLSRSWGCGTAHERKARAPSNA